MEHPAKRPGEVTADGLLTDMDRLRVLLKEKLTAYKVPRRFHVLTALPRNEMGKVLRREVNKLLQEVDRLRKGTRRRRPVTWTGRRGPAGAGH